MEKYLKGLSMCCKLMRVTRGTYQTQTETRAFWVMVGVGTQKGTGRCS